MADSLPYYIHNPFPQNNIANPGQPLNEVVFPATTTLISRNITDSSQLSMISLQQYNTKLSNTRPVDVQDVGIQLDVSLPGQIPGLSSSKINVNQIPTNFSEQALPRTYDEALGKMDRIDMHKSGKTNMVYNRVEMQQIASNLSLSTTGSKQDLVQRIREAVFRFYNKPDPKQPNV